MTPSQVMGLARTRVGGVPVHCVDLDQALEVIDGFVRDRKPHYNVAINALKVVEYHKDPQVRDAVDRAHLLTADGMPVVWASRLTRGRIPGRANGTDLMEALIASAVTRGYSLYFFGATQDIVEACIRIAGGRHPGIWIAGYRNGYFAPADEPAIVAAIRESRADILFLGFGSPTKELFMRRWVEELGVPFVMGVGGSFDVYAGLVQRAPNWMQRSGLEWFHRFLAEPRRMWRRYLTGNLAFIWYVLTDAARRRVATSDPG